MQENSTTSRKFFSRSRAASPPKSRTARRIEIVLFLLGGILLSIWVGFTAYSKFSQVYYDWAFERLVRDRPAPMAEFLRVKLLGRRDEPAAVPESAMRETGVRARQYAPGALIGRLEIPDVGLSVMMLEGTGRKALTEGIGHIEGTVLPGRPGNSGLAGHRDTYFRALKDIAKDDLIKVTTLDGTYTYKVEGTRVVYPSATSVLDETPEPTLTLVTCYPFYYVGDAPKRFIVRARLLP